MSDVEAEFDEIEDELGLAEKKTVEENVEAIKRILRGGFYQMKQLLGILIFLNIMLLICFIIALIIL